MKARQLVLALALAGCGAPDAERAPSRHERLIAGQVSGDERRDANPCVRREISWFQGQEVAILHSLRPRDCVPLLPAKVMRGVWFYGFESSGFIPDVDRVDLHREISGNSSNPEFDTLLDADVEEAFRRMGLTPCRSTCAYAITFVGQRSRDPGPYYTSEGNHVVVVNALLTGRLLGRVTTTVCFPDRPCFDIP